MKKCPFCAEEIQDEANYCRFCKHWLDERINEIARPGIPRENYTKTGQHQAVRGKTSYVLFIGFLILLIIMIILGINNKWFPLNILKPPAISENPIKVNVEPTSGIKNTPMPSSTPTWESTPFLPFGGGSSNVIEFSFPKGAKSIASTWSTSKDWTKWVDDHARNLAIPAGKFEWSYAEFPGDTTYRDIERYYLDKLPSIGYRLLFNEQGQTYSGSYEIFILKMTNDSYYFLAQFWGAEGKYPPAVLVFRWRK